MGISRTFQNIRLFGDLTVAENIIIARHCRRQSGMLDALFNTKRVREEEAENQAFIEKCLNYVGIYDKKDWLAKNLPYGMQRRLEIARALATEPSLILSLIHISGSGAVYCGWCIHGGGICAGGTGGHCQNAGKSPVQAFR